MAYYPTPTGNDTRGLFEFFAYTNTVSDGLMFPVIMLVIWVIMFIATKRYSVSRAWTMSSFFCFILSVPLVVMGMFSPKYMYLLILLLAVGVVWLKMKD